MIREPRRINVAPDSEIAVVMREAAANGTGLEVQTGEETYQAAVTSATTDQRARRLRQLAHELAGSLATVDIPGWQSSESAERWVDELRQADIFPLEPPSGTSKP